MDWKFWVQAFLSGVAALYTALEYYRGGGRTVSQGRLAMRRPFVVIGVLLLLTWAAVGFDYWDRHRQGAGSILNVITNYGLGQGVSGCHAGIDTGQFLDFRKKYMIALVCGLQDPTVDQLSEPRIGVSAQFTITGQVFLVVAQYHQEMLNVLRTKGENDLTSVWFEAVLIPKDIDMAVIRRLSDVTKYGGKILDEKYFE